MKKCIQTTQARTIPVLEFHLTPEEIVELIEAIDDDLLADLLEKRIEPEVMKDSIEFMHSFNTIFDGKEFVISCEYDLKEENE